MSLCLRIIKFYKKAVSPYIFPCCRFYPTCSEYAYEALLKYGIVKGVFVSFKRLIKCNPFGPSGYDPLL